jgi:negative regulator of sigma E activity
MTDINKKANNLEDALKHALRRQDAPEDFTQQVMARVAAQNSAQQPARDSWLSLFTQPIMRWAVLAAVAAAMIFGVHIYQERREHAQGEAAKQRLMLALRVAGSKLQLAKAKVNEMNANPNKTRQVKE